jgi:hypothetical protein
MPPRETAGSTGRLPALQEMPIGIDSFAYRKERALGRLLVVGPPVYITTKWPNMSDSWFGQ